MTKTTINLILLSLVSMLAVACGDPSVSDFEDDFDVDPEAAFDPAFDSEIPFDPEPGDLNDLGPEFEGANEEPRGEDPAAPPAVVDELVEGVFGQPLGPDDVELIGATPEGFALPGTYEAKIDIKLHLTSVLPSGPSRVDTCEAGLLLDVGSSTATAGGSCPIFDGLLEFSFIVDLIDDERVEGEISFFIDGVSNTVALRGVYNDNLLSLEFDGVTLVAPNVRGVWIGNVLAGVR